MHESVFLCVQAKYVLITNCTWYSSRSGVNGTHTYVRTITGGNKYNFSYTGQGAAVIRLYHLVRPTVPAPGIDDVEDDPMATLSEEQLRFCFFCCCPHPLLLCRLGSNKKG